MELSSVQIEAINRNEVCSRFIRLGWKTATPDYDMGGVDLWLKRDSGPIIEVQLKSGICTDPDRYGNRDIWMLFPDKILNLNGKEPRNWYLIPHDKLFEVVRTKHGNSAKWNGKWRAPYVTADMAEKLSAFRIPESLPHPRFIGEADDIKIIGTFKFGISLETQGEHCQLVLTGFDETNRTYPKRVISVTDEQIKKYEMTKSLTNSFPQLTEIDRDFILKHNRKLT
jgi:hypothetical protein